MLIFVLSSFSPSVSFNLFSSSSCGTPPNAILLSIIFITIPFFHFERLLQELSPLIPPLFSPSPSVSSLFSHCNIHLFLSFLPTGSPLLLFYLFFFHLHSSLSHLSSNHFSPLSLSISTSPLIIFSFFSLSCSTCHRSPLLSSLRPLL